MTPFASNQSVAWDKLEENLSKLNTEPLAGYLVHGSNGEFCYLDTRERLEMVKTVRSLCGPGKLLLAGSGAESTLETVRMTEAMAAAGADVAVVVSCHRRRRSEGEIQCFPGENKKKRNNAIAGTVLSLMVHFIREAR